MVEYTKWTSIVFDEAPSRAEATDIISWASQRWNERKDDLQDATVSEARQYARRQL